MVADGIRLKTQQISITSGSAASKVNPGMLLKSGWKQPPSGRIAFAQNSMYVFVIFQGECYSPRRRYFAIRFIFAKVPILEEKNQITGMISFRRIFLLLLFVGGIHSVYGQLAVRFIPIDSSSNDTIYNFQIFRDGKIDEQIWPDSNGFYLIDTSGDFKLYLLSEGYSDLVILKNQLSSFTTVYLYADFATIQEVNVNSRLKQRTFTVGRKKTIAESNLPLGKGYYYDYVVDLSSIKGQLELVSFNLDVSKNEDDSTEIPVTWQLFKLSSSFPCYKVNEQSYAFNIVDTLLKDSLNTDRYNTKIIMNTRNIKLGADEKYLLLRIYSNSNLRVILPFRGNLDKINSKCKSRNCLCITFNGRSSRYIPLAQQYYNFEGAIVNSTWSKNVVPRLSITMTQSKLSKRVRIKK